MPAWLTGLGIARHAGTYCGAASSSNSPHYRVRCASFVLVGGIARDSIPNNTPFTLLTEISVVEVFLGDVVTYIPFLLESGSVAANAPPSVS